MSKTYDEKIAEAKIELRQLENHMKRLMQSQKAEQRKQRTRRLIERGAIIESLAPRSSQLTNEQFKIFISEVLKNYHYKIPQMIEEIRVSGDDKTNPNDAVVEHVGAGRIGDGVDSGD
jgi:hypothetical protein